MIDDSAPLHGGTDALGAPAHDFSTNANALGPCPHTLEALHAADPTRYPDPAYTALREQLAAFHGIRRERIVLAASASEFITRITAAVAQTSKGAAVQVPLHAYGDYARAARSWGLNVQARPGDARPALIWACDPSAPLGQAHAGLSACIDTLPPNVPLVLDRAYEPLRLRGAIDLDAAQLARVWQLWSPNKALGLTGVRGAYVIAPESGAAFELQGRLLQLAPSWPLGAHAVAMLHSWAETPTQQWLAECLPTLRRWKAAQQSLCRDLGWTVLDSDSNYFCADWSVALGQRSAQQLLQALRMRGVKLRDAASFGLAGHVRLGVRGIASQAALAEAWVASVRQ